MITPNDIRKSTILLNKKCDASFICNLICGGCRKYPKNIAVVREGVEIALIINTHHPKCCPQLPCYLHEIHYGRG